MTGKTLPIYCKKSPESYRKICCEFWLDSILYCIYYYTYMIRTFRQFWQLCLHPKSSKLDTSDHYRELKIGDNLNIIYLYETLLVFFVLPVNFTINKNSNAITSNVARFPRISWNIVKAAKSYSAKTILINEIPAFLYIGIIFSCFKIKPCFVRRVSNFYSSSVWPKI